MTEDDWRHGTDPLPMLEFLKGKASDRKLRLFACACAREVWDRKWAGSVQKAVAVAERYAEGDATDQELHRVRSSAAVKQLGLPAGIHPLRVPPDVRTALWRPRLAVEATYTRKPFLVSRLRGIGADPDLRSLAPALLRCIFGNPFRPVVFPDSWRTPDTLALATAAYEERFLPCGRLDRTRLPVLADALEDAGGTPDATDHLRRDSPHVRGCWVIDRILGRHDAHFGTVRALLPSS